MIFLHQASSRKWPLIREVGSISGWGGWCQQTGSSWNSKQLYQLFSIANCVSLPLYPLIEKVW